MRRPRRATMFGLAAALSVGLAVTTATAAYASVPGDLRTNTAGFTCNTDGNMTQDEGQWPFWYYNCEDHAVEVRDDITDAQGAEEHTEYFCVPADAAVMTGFAYGYPRGYARATGNTCTPE